jgi:hypothetical protein
MTLPPLALASNISCVPYTHCGEVARQWSTNTIVIGSGETTKTHQNVREREKKDMK